jgi:hypothetical protein
VDGGICRPADVAHTDHDGTAGEALSVVETIAAGRRDPSWRRALGVRNKHAAVERRVRATRTAGDVETRQAVEERLPGGGDRGAGGRRTPREQLLRERQRGGDAARAEQPAVPDFHEPPREYVQEEAAEGKVAG